MILSTNCFALFFLFLSHSLSLYRFISQCLSEFFEFSEEYNSWETEIRDEYWVVYYVNLVMSILDAVLNFNHSRVEIHMQYLHQQ